MATTRLSNVRFTLNKYGTEAKMNEVHHYETYEIKDSQGRQILPPN